MWLPFRLNICHDLPEREPSPRLSIRVLPYSANQKLKRLTENMHDANRTVEKQRINSGHIKVADEISM